MEKEIQEKVFEYIDALAAKVGVASEQLFKTLVKQQLIEGITGMAMYLVFLLIAIVFIKVGLRWFSKRDKNFDVDKDFHPSYFLFISAGVILIIWTLAFALDFKDTLTQVMNPEYHAIQDILDVFKS